MEKALLAHINPAPSAMHLRVNSDFDMMCSVGG
jgi:hypothetical protein